MSSPYTVLGLPPDPKSKELRPYLRRGLRMRLAECKKKRGTTIYISQSGNDAAGHTGSRAKPFRTVSKALAILTSLGGVTNADTRIAFRRGDLWREGLPISWSAGGVTIGAWGTGSLPQISWFTSTFDSGTSWTSTTLGSYHTPCPVALAAVRVQGIFSPLEPVFTVCHSQAECDATATSFYSDGTTLYVNANIGVPTALSVTASGTVTGTAQSGANSTIRLATSASSTDSAYNGQNVTILQGTGAGQTKAITGYVGSTTTATISGTWATNPDNTSVYVIAGGTTTYNYRVSALTAAGHETNAATQVSVGGPPTLTPANYNKLSWLQVNGAASYRVYGRLSNKEVLIGIVAASTAPFYQFIDSGQFPTAQSGSSSTLQVATTESATDGSYVGAIVGIISGTGSGQINTVASYVGATRTMTMTGNWSTAPDSTSVYGINSGLPVTDTGLSPTTLNLEGVPVQTLTGIQIPDTDGCRVEDLDLYGNGCSEGHAIYGVQFVGSGNNGAVVKNVQSRYNGYHCFGGTSNTTGGIFTALRCTGGLPRDGFSQGPADGVTTFVHYSNDGGGEQWLWSCTVDTGYLPDSRGTSGSAVFSHTGNGVPTAAIIEYKLWQRSHVTAYNQVFLYASKVSTGSPANFDLSAVRCWIIGRKIGDSVSSPVYGSSFQFTIAEPDAWSTGHRYYLKPSSQANGTIGSAIQNGWCANLTLWMDVSLIGYTCILGGQGQGLEYAKVWHSYIQMAYQNTYNGAYGGGMQRGGPILGEINDEMKNSIYAGSTLPVPDAGGTGHGLYVDLNNNIGTTTNKQVNNAYYGIATAYNGTTTGSSGNYGNDPTAVTLTIVPDPDNYLTYLAPQLATVVPAGVQYDRDFNLRTTGLIGPAVQGSDGIVDEDDWDSATEILDAAGWEEADPEGSVAAFVAPQVTPTVNSSGQVTTSNPGSGSPIVTLQIGP